MCAVVATCRAGAPAGGTDWTIDHATHHYKIAQLRSLQWHPHIDQLEGSSCLISLMRKPSKGSVCHFPWKQQLLISKTSIPLATSNTYKLHLAHYKQHDLNGEGGLQRTFFPPIEIHGLHVCKLNVDLELLQTHKIVITSMLSTASFRTTLTRSCVYLLLVLMSTCGQHVYISVALCAESKQAHHVLLIQLFDSAIAILHLCSCNALQWTILCVLK